MGADVRGDVTIDWEEREEYRQLGDTPQRSGLQACRLGRRVHRQGFFFRTHQS